jgi:hypothetical protein
MTSKIGASLKGWDSPLSSVPNNMLVAHGRRLDSGECPGFLTTQEGSLG